MPDSDGELMYVPTAPIPEATGASKRKDALVKPTPPAFVTPSERIGDQLSALVGRVTGAVEESTVRLHGITDKVHDAQTDSHAKTVAQIQKHVAISEAMGNLALKFEAELEALLKAHEG